MNLTRQNWSQTLDLVIDRLSDVASKYDAKSIERRAILFEVNSLRELRDHLRTIPAGNRREFNSPLVAMSVRDYLDVPPDIIEQVGRLYDRYRRWKNDREWIV